MNNSKLTLVFEVDSGEPIDKNYLSACIRMTEDSKKALREVLGNTVQFDNIDNSFSLDPRNFYIWRNNYSSGASRDELYVKNEKGDCLAGNIALDYYKFLVEISPNDEPISDYGFYYKYAISHPDVYDRLQNRKFDDYGQLLPVTLNILDNILSNTNGLTTNDILLQLQNTIANNIRQEEEERIKKEQEFHRQNEELTNLIKSGEIILFEVVKGDSIDGRGYSSAILQPAEISKKALDVGDISVKLDKNKFYVDEYYGERLRYVDDRYDEDGMVYLKDLFFVSNKSADYNLKSGLYTIPDLNSYAEHLNTENIYSMSNLTTNDVLLQLQNTIEDNIKKEEKKRVEEELELHYQSDMPLQLQNIIEDDIKKKGEVVVEKDQDHQNEELTNLVKSGEIILFKTVKDDAINDSEHSSVGLQLVENSKQALSVDDVYIKLNQDKFYIAGYRDDEILHYIDNEGNDTQAHLNDLFFVSNKSSYPIGSGFYTILDFDFYAKYLSTNNICFME